MHDDNTSNRQPSMMEAITQDWAPGAAVSRLRLVTAASLFDGDDAAVHIMRRLIRTRRAEVVHIGHHRSVVDVVRAAVQEDADAIVISSQHGGDVGYFRHMVEMLHSHGVGYIPVFVSAGGRLTMEEQVELEASGVAQVYRTHVMSGVELTEMVTEISARAGEARVVARKGRGRAENRSSAMVGAAEAEASSSTSDAGPQTDNNGHNAQATPSPVPPPSQLHSQQSPHSSDQSWGSAASGLAQTRVLFRQVFSSHSEAATPPPLPVASQDEVEDKLGAEKELAIARMLTSLEEKSYAKTEFHTLRRHRPWTPGTAPVIGITGTGGAGKSSVTDELLTRFLAAFPDMRIAVVSVDPTRRRSGGALLGDRLRMNALRSSRVYMRSMATRRQNMATSVMLQECIQYLKSEDFDLVIVETAGIGQSDSAIVDLVDLPVYVMTSDYGAASQLEKIDMLDYADLVVLNKYDQRGAVDALHDIRQQWRRNHSAYDLADEDVPVYPTIANQFDDPGLGWMFVNLCRLVRERMRESFPQTPPSLGLQTGVEITSGTYSLNPLSVRCDFNPPFEAQEKIPDVTSLIPAQRLGYLAEIAEHGRGINIRIQAEAEQLGRAQQCWQALGELGDPERPSALAPYPAQALDDTSVDASLRTLRQCYHASITDVSADALHKLQEWQSRLAGETGELLREEFASKALARHSIPRMAAPHYRHWGDLLRFLGKEHLPGYYPYTSGIDASVEKERPPVAITASEGTPERGNYTLHILRQRHEKVQLCVVFDRVTLYGEDPGPRSDIEGKIGHDGVNVPTLDAMKKLFSGFDLCAPEISIGLDADGPALILLAMLFNTAIDQQVERYLREDPQRWQQAQHTIDTIFSQRQLPLYDAQLPPGHDTLGLGLLGLSGDQLVDQEIYAQIRAETLSKLCGCVQMDVLEEEQVRNTCIFSPGFALRMLGDFQQYRIEHGIEQFHVGGMSGVGFANVGAHPITQLAFTLANGLTLVEYYLARGLEIDQIVPDICFSFAIGDELEYSVFTRVARRVWARAMLGRYGANADSQRLKSRLQRVRYSENLHQEGERLPGVHTIFEREWGVEMGENPWQASFIIDTLTDLVEDAVYREFDAISARGGVLGAMGTRYQCDKIHDERMQYEHTRTTPAVGDRSMSDEGTVAASPARVNLTAAERARQIENLRVWQGLRGDLAHSHDFGAQAGGLLRLQQAACGQGNVFAVLMEVVKTYSLGQISHALYAAGGEYRRTM